MVKLVNIQPNRENKIGRVSDVEALAQRVLGDEFFVTRYANFDSVSINHLNWHTRHGIDSNVADVIVDESRIMLYDPKYMNEILRFAQVYEATYVPEGKEVTVEKTERKFYRYTGKRIDTPSA